jgi:hypothetical protein
VRHFVEAFDLEGGSTSKVVGSMSSRQGRVESGLTVRRPRSAWVPVTKSEVRGGADGDNRDGDGDRDGDDGDGDDDNRDRPAPRPR